MRFQCDIFICYFVLLLFIRLFIIFVMICVFLRLIIFLGFDIFIFCRISIFSIFFSSELLVRQSLKEFLKQISHARSCTDAVDFSSCFQSHLCPFFSDLVEGFYIQMRKGSTYFFAAFSAEVQFAQPVQTLGNLFRSSQFQNDLGTPTKRTLEQRIRTHNQIMTQIKKKLLMSIVLKDLAKLPFLILFISVILLWPFSGQKY